MEQVLRACSECGQVFDAIAFLPSDTVCSPCATKAMDARILAWRMHEAGCIPQIADGILARLGMAGKERAAELERVPLELKRHLPGGPVKALLVGQMDPKGFGLGGGAGIGKTQALAAIVRRGVETRLRGALQEVQEIPASYDPAWHRWIGRFKWVNWPAWAAWAKGTVTKRNGGEEVEAAVDHLCTARLLVLDDLGRERTRGSYTEDFAMGQLDRILDARDREGGHPVLWTTNSTDEDLNLIYGAAMMSRLLGMAPLVRLPNLPDLRLQ